MITETDPMQTPSQIVLAFSGGLDTSFCVPWLIEQGYEVTTLFVDTGGVDDAERDYIAERSKALGASEHVVENAAYAVWDEVVVPLVRGGQWYQGQYPLLCSDRYVIVRRALELCDRIGARAIAHGCTGMGNDQVRFDLSVRALGDYQIIAPVREVQRAGKNVREFEMRYLADRGHTVSSRASRYTINENILGVTISGSEIDAFDVPGPDTYKLTRPRADWPPEALTLKIEFNEGVPVAVNDQELDGPSLLKYLNDSLGDYGIGRGIYTGDTTVGLKGRIVFEAPALTALAIAHRALEEATCTRHQNAVKPFIATKWVELVYQGLFFEPLKDDLEAYLAVSQNAVTGTVTLSTEGGSIMAVAVDSDRLMKSAEAVYAQSSNWSVAEAEGFIKLFGQSSSLWSDTRRVADNGEE
jgi:argininosuccinate synthase